MNINPFIEINHRKIGIDHLPYVIAEMSANHNGSLDNAFKLIDAAHRSGADAVKLQTYTADTITLNANTEDFQIHGGLWMAKRFTSFTKKRRCLGNGTNLFLNMPEN